MSTKNPVRLHVRLAPDDWLRLVQGAAGPDPCAGPRARSCGLPCACSTGCGSTSRRGAGFVLRNEDLRQQVELYLSQAVAEAAPEENRGQQRLGP